MAPNRIPNELRHPGADPGCKTCQGLGLQVVPDGERAAAAPCACVERCPSCRGTGLVAVGKDFRAPQRRCVCQVVRARWRAFDAVGVPARHAGSTLLSFVDNNTHQTSMKTAVSAYLREFDPTAENRGLVLFGDVGTGKTHLIVALLRDLVLRHGVRVKFVEFSHLLADLKSGFDIGRGMAALIDPLVDVDVLAIDELGKGRNTEFEGTVLDELVSRRYNAMRPILATTNYGERKTGRARANAAAVQVGIEATPGLADRVGDRVYSRLRETCDFLKVQGEDHRMRKGRQRG